MHLFRMIRTLVLKKCLFTLKTATTRLVHQTKSVGYPRRGHVEKQIKINEINQEALKPTRSLLEETQDYEVVKEEATIDTKQQNTQSDDQVIQERRNFDLIKFNEIPTQIEFERIDDILKNEESLAKCQATLKEMIKQAKNEFYFYYLIEKYGRDFSVGNLISFIGCLAKMRRDNETQFAIPLKIQQVLDKLVIKYSPHFEPHNCAFTFSYLNKLDLNLDNNSMLALIQLLKYHVNNLDLQVVLAVKSNLEEAKSRSSLLTFDNKQFVHELCVSLDEALLYAVQLKQNDLKHIKTPKCFIEILKYFGNSLSPINYQHAIGNFMDQAYMQSNEALLDFCEILADKKYKHVNYLEKISREIVKRLDTYKYDEFIRNEEVARNQSNDFFISRLLKSLIKLDFYDRSLTNALYAKSIEILKALPNDFNLTPSHVEALNILLEYLIQSRHKSIEFVECFYDDLLKRFGDKMENVLNYADLIYYSALLEHKE